VACRGGRPRHASARSAWPHGPSGRSSWSAEPACAALALACAWAGQGGLRLNAPEEQRQGGRARRAQRQVPARAARQRLPLPRVQRLKLLKVLRRARRPIARPALAVAERCAQLKPAVRADCRPDRASGSVSRAEHCGTGTAQAQQSTRRTSKACKSCFALCAAAGADLASDGRHVGQVRPMRGAVALEERGRVSGWQHQHRRLRTAAHACPRPRQRAGCALEPVLSRCAGTGARVKVHVYSLLSCTQC